MKNTPWSTIGLLASIGYLLFWGTEKPPYVNNFIIAFVIGLIPLVLTIVGFFSVVNKTKANNGAGAVGSIFVGIISLLIICLTYFLFYLSISCSKAGGC